MSYISQMPMMRTRATSDGIVVNEVLKYYRVSLLRAQVRLDLDLDGQQYVAEHQTFASFCKLIPTLLIRHSSFQLIAG